MKIIGLTGGIASGKSTVSRLFNEHGIPVLDADLIAREVVEVGSVGLQQIKEQFGEQVLHANGELNRQVLGQMIFQQPQLRQQLNEILQPLIRQQFHLRIQEFDQQNEPLIVLDVPLLFEMKYEEFCDEIIVVYVSSDTQLRRLMQRNQFTKEEAKERIASQLSLDEKKLRADIVFDNNGDFGELEKQVSQWLQNTKNAILQINLSEEE